MKENKLIEILNKLNIEYKMDKYNTVSYIYCRGYLFYIRNEYNILVKVSADYKSNNYEKTKKLSGIKGYAFINEESIKELLKYAISPKCIHANSVIRKIFDSRADITEEEYFKIIELLSRDEYRNYDYYKFIKEGNKSILKLIELRNCIYNKITEKSYIEINIKD